MTAILGGSNSGKSTLLLALTGQPETLLNGKSIGDVEFGGELAVVSAPQKVGVVFQQPDSSFCNLKVWEEVAFGLERIESDPALIRARVAHALHRVGLEGYGDKRVYELSGGESQRLAWAAAIATDPLVLLLDEAFSSLDPSSLEAFKALINFWRGSGRSVVYTSNEWTDWTFFADQVVLLDGGEVKISGPPVSVFESVRECLPRMGIAIPRAAEAALAAEYVADKGEVFETRAGDTLSALRLLTKVIAQNK